MDESGCGRHQSATSGELQATSVLNRLRNRGTQTLTWMGNHNIINTAQLKDIRYNAVMSTTVLLSGGNEGGSVGGAYNARGIYQELDQEGTSFIRSQPSSSSTIVLSLRFPCLFEGLTGRSRVGLAVVACNNCGKSRGKVDGVGGGRIGVVACERLRKIDGYVLD